MLALSPYVRSHHFLVHCASPFRHSCVTEVHIYVLRPRRADTALKSTTRVDNYPSKYR